MLHFHVYTGRTALPVPHFTSRVFRFCAHFQRERFFQAEIDLVSLGGDIGDDPIVVVLTENVSDAHLAGLRDDGISYIFAGERALDLRRALDIPNRELRIERLEVNGGGVTNGAFLRAGLIDEISLAIFPAVDGTKGAPCVFDSGEEAEAAAPLRAMMLESSEVLEGGAVWLRYRVQNG